MNILRRGCPPPEEILMLICDELEDRKAVKLRDHLSRCEICVATAEELRGAHDDAESALTTGVSAPATLDARVMATLRAAPKPRFSWPSFVPPWSTTYRFASMAAAACLLLAGFLGGQAMQPQPVTSPTTVASIIESKSLQLTDLRDDHLRSLTDPQAVTVKGAAPKQVVAQLAELAEKGNGNDVELMAVDLRPSGLKLLGGRWSEASEKPVGFLCYQWGDKRVSIYQNNADTLPIPALVAAEESAGENTERCYLAFSEGEIGYVAWCEGNTNFVMIAEAAPEKLLALAQEQAQQQEKNATRA